MTGADVAGAARECHVLTEADGLCSGAMGRLAALIGLLALASLGFAGWAVLRMLDGAATDEVLLWVSGAWVAWSSIIAIKLWAWTRANPLGLHAFATIEDRR